MDWQIQLITLYEMVCKHYQEELWIHCQRFSPYCDLSFTDEEVITLFLFGIMSKTGIQKASKVRSSSGLLVHVFGRLAAAMFIFVFPEIFGSA